MKITRLKPGESNDRWTVREYIGGATPVKYVFKCNSCGRSKTATKQLYDRGFCDCRHKKQNAKYKKEYKEVKEKKERVKTPPKKKSNISPSIPSSVALKLDSRGVRSLLASILYSTRSDAKRGHNLDNVEWFINSDWCVEICEGLDIPYNEYRKKILDLINKSSKTKEAGKK